MSAITVVKIGTNTLTTPDAQLDLNVMRHLVDQMAQIMLGGTTKIVLVTSGAITCGAEALKFRPQSISEKQAAAAVGQILLMREYAQFFGDKGISVGQILLTKDCTEDPIRKRNTENTIFTLLDQGILPIINENDSVATDEIGVKFGDNDELSASVAKLVHATQLILLTDIDGLFTANPKLDPTATLIREISDISDDTLGLIQEAPNGRSRGGMTSKLTCAKDVSDAGIEVVLANGRRANILRDIMDQRAIGTWIRRKS